MRVQAHLPQLCLKRQRLILSYASASRQQNMLSEKVQATMMEVDGLTILDLFLTGWWAGIKGCQTQLHSSDGSRNTGFTYS